MALRVTPATPEEEAEYVTDQELAAVFVEKFAGSPRNPYGTHNSFEFKGGQAGYRKAWRLHFSQINGGRTTPAASGPIRGTVRRVAMIAAAMKPPCKVVGSENIGARTGAKSPLKGEFPQKPSDYGLDRWKKPGEEDVDPEKALRFTCNDLNVIKRAATAEIKRRIADREKKELSPEEAELFEFLKDCETLCGTKPVALDGEEEDVGDVQKWTAEFRLTKAIAKKKIVYGIVYAPEEPDAHDCFMTAEQVEMAAHRFMLASQKMDDFHNFVDGAGAPVESFIARKGDPDFPEGAWVLGAKVFDEKVWKQITKGEIRSFSLAGMARFGKTKEMESRWYDDDGNMLDPFGDEEAA